MFFAWVRKELERLRERICSMLLSVGRRFENILLGFSFKKLMTKAESWLFEIKILD